MPKGFDFTPYPSISRWIEKIQKLPYHDECNKDVIKMIRSVLSSKQKPVIEFYHYYTSPFSRAVHMTLEALGLKYEMKEVDFPTKQHKSPEYLKINPKGEVPALRIGNFCLVER